MNHLDKDTLLEVATGNFSVGIHNIVSNVENSVTGCLNVAKAICEYGLNVNRVEGGTAAGTIYKNYRIYT